MTASARTRKGRKAKVKAVTLPAWDKGAEGPANQARLRTEAVTEINAITGKEQATGGKRKRRQTWVEIYEGKGWISKTQLKAAERLVRAAEGFPDRDPLAPIIGSRPAGSFDPQAARVDARAWFRETWDKVPISSRPVLQRIVLDDDPVWGDAGQAGRERHIQRLRVGLDAIS